VETATYPRGFLGATPGLIPWRRKLIHNEFIVKNFLF
jgi:hypothetical protein